MFICCCFYSAHEKGSRDLTVDVQPYTLRAGALFVLGLAPVAAGVGRHHGANVQRPATHMGDDGLRQDA